MSRLMRSAFLVFLLIAVARVPGVGATTRLSAGPYALLVAIEAAPLRAGQVFPLRICSAPGGPTLDGASVTVATIPAAGTVGVIGVPIGLSVDPDVPGCVAGQLLIGATGAWALRVTVAGASGNGDAALPLAVEESAPVPIWLGWVIGLTPLLGFGWLAVWQTGRWRRLAVMSGGEPG